MRFFIYLIVFLTGAVCLAQNRPTHFTDSTGALYWRKSTPVYLFVSDAPDGDKERLKSKATAQYADPFYLDTEGVNYIRSRNAVDPETKRVIPDSEVMFEIYADGIAPVTSVSYENVNKFQGDLLYYKAGVNVSLEAKDQLSGVRKLEYAINDGKYTPYQKPLTFQDPGVYKVEYYSEDEVGNVEDKKSISFVVDPTPPYSDLTINGITEDEVISTGSKLYILALDSISGVASVYYKFDDQPFKKYNGLQLPTAQLEEGEHTITYYAEDKVKNVEEHKSFTFFLDKSAPLMVADVLGDRFIVMDEVYFSGRTKLKLTAVDNKVGVKEVMYSVDNEEFKKYEKPFYLPSVSGVHLIKYYSVDNLDNSTADSKNSRYIGQGGFEEFKHNVNKFYVDLTGPVINHSIGNYTFTRSDTLFIGPYSKIKLTGTDPESGFKSIAYSLGSDVGEELYTEPFTLTREGFNTLNYYGYDNVNNRNIAKFTFYLDATAPNIFIQFNTGNTDSREGKLVYPITSGIFLSATDKTSGVNSVTYSLDDAPFKPYAGLISGMKKGKHTLVVKAKDFLNNEAVKEVTFHIK